MNLQTVCRVNIRDIQEIMGSRLRARHCLAALVLCETMMQSCG